MATTETQEQPAMEATPQQEHQWLQKFVGEWDMEGEMPDKPGEKFGGTESVRSIGGLWVVGEGQGDMPGAGEMTMITTFGYDPQKGKFVGTFIASMMTNLWIYEGTLNPTETTLTLDTEGPNMMAGGKITLFRDVVEFKDDDHRVLTSHMMGDDGQWQVIMKGHYRRRK